MQICKQKGDGMRKKDVLEFYEDSIKEVCQVLNIYPQAFAYWKDVIPKARAYELYVKSEGKIPLREKDYEIQTKRGRKRKE